MNIITKYMLKQMLFGFVLITTGLLMIVWLSQSLRLFEILMNSKVSIMLFIQLTLMLVPNYLAVISPIALFSVTLFTYNRLIADRELTILRAAGQSPMQLARPVFMIGICAMLVGFYISLDVVPRSVTRFKELSWKIQHDVSHLLLQPGEFNDVGHGVTIYVRTKHDNGDLEEIIIRNKKEQTDSDVIITAQKGSIVYKNAVPFISMEKGSRQEVDKSGRFSILYFDSYNMNFLSPKEKNWRRAKPAERSLSELFFTPKEDFRDKKTYHQFRIEGIRRLTQPFYNLAFMLIAVTGLLTGNFNRQGHGKRLVYTVIAMAFVQIMGLGIENLAMQKLFVLPLMFFPPIMVICVCPYILKHAGTFDTTKWEAFYEKYFVQIEKICSDIYEKIKLFFHSIRFRKK